MSKYVIRRHSDGRFMKGGYSLSPLDWVDSIQNARVYGRLCDVSNSIREHFGTRRNSWQGRKEFAANYEIVPVVLVQLKTGD